jgi:hypothetical protein
MPMWAFLPLALFTLFGTLIADPIVKIVPLWLLVMVCLAEAGVLGPIR